MSQALRKITGNIGKSGCTVIINQLRQKSVSPTAAQKTGGNALKFYARCDWIFAGFKH